MIDIANIEFQFDTAPIGERLLQRHASTLFDDWEEYLGAGLALPDYSLHLELAEGSVRGRGTILTRGVQLAVAIATYGSFVNGTTTIAKQARAAGTFLIGEATEFFEHSAIVPPKAKRNAGRIGQLERLFQRVRRGELTPPEAAHLANALFENESDIPPEFLRSMKAAILQTRRVPEQMILPFEELDAIEADSGQERKPQPRKPPFIPAVPATRYRVEIWRESKRGRRRMTIEPL